MVQINRVLLRALCRRVEDTNDPQELVKLNDGIGRLINEKRHSILLARRRAFRVIVRGKRRINVTRRAA
jgi:hypothetical protein